MLFSAAETFRYECVGFLFGLAPTPRRNYYLLSLAIPNQHAKRTFKKIIRNGKALKRTVEFLNRTTHVYPSSIGDFHSHTEWRHGEKPDPCLSEMDIGGIGKGEVEIVISISRRRKGDSYWQSLRDGSIRGSMGGYNFRVNAYDVHEEEGREAPRNLKVVIPKLLCRLNRLRWRQLFKYRERKRREQKLVA